MIKTFLSWIYSDPKYSASYFKNLIDTPIRNLPSKPKAPETQQPSSQPSQSKAKGKGSQAIGASPATQQVSPPIMRPPPAKEANPATQPVSPPIMHPPPTQPQATQPQPQPQSSNAASSAHNPNTQPVILKT